MLNTKFIAVAAVAISGLFMNTAANAEAYAGATVGRAFWNINCDGATTCNKNDTDFKLLAGYNFNQHFGIEAGYYSLGTTQASDRYVSVEMKSTGVDLSGVYRTQFGSSNWGMMTKLGLGYNKAEATGAYSIYRGVSTKKAANLVAGVGITYAFTPNFSARAEIETRRIEFVGGNDGNVSNFNIGLQANF